MNENKRVVMPVVAAEVRNKNFTEVATGLTKEMAIAEAKRCLNCKNKPCVSGCPVGVDIPAFVKLVAEGNFEAAMAIITKANSLPAVCGRVCPQESQCEGVCVRGIKGESVSIGALERFVADYHRTHCIEEVVTKIPKNAKKVAVIGSGPSGLACAGELAKNGINVTIFEALHEPGGVLVYGIPEFRLPKAVVKSEIQKLKMLGVEIATNMVIGKILTVEELFDDGYEAIYIGSGAGLPNFMEIPGESINGVYSANEYLTRVNLMKAYCEDYKTPIKRSKNVVVVGGGNVAMDASRCAKRLGAENVTILYRRSRNELPARKEEVIHAEEEGIAMQVLTCPVEIVGDDSGVTGIICQKTELGLPDEQGRRRANPIAGSEFEVACDTVIMSVGTSPNPLLRNSTKGLETNRKGCIITKNEAGLTSIDGIYAGGDAVTGAATVILAMGAGKKAAEAIVEQIKM